MATPQRLKLKKYTITIPNPAGIPAFLVVESIVSFKLPEDSMYLVNKVAGDNVDLFFMIDEELPLVTMRVLVLAENERTQREFGSFLGYVTLTFGERALFELE